MVLITFSFFFYVIKIYFERCPQVCSILRLSSYEISHAEVCYAYKVCFKSSFRDSLEKQ